MSTTSGSSPWLLLLLLSTVAGCRTGAPEEAVQGGVGENGAPCFRLQTEGFAATRSDSLTWRGTGQEEMDAWCQAVGPALAYRPPRPWSQASLPGLAVVSWNVHSGGGDVDALIRDLREGRLDGKPAISMVLFLQEVYRSGRNVPGNPGRGSETAERVAAGPEERESRSIEALARRNGLHLLYVPSMRNGDAGDPPEDRGNAILSTFPLTHWTALELPLENQRRVAVSARGQLLFSGGEVVPIQLGNVHFDHRSLWRRGYRSLGAGRARQARALLEEYGSEEAVLLGGDLNTWAGGKGERAVRLLREAFPQPETDVDSRTVPTPWILPDLDLDHLFFRLPESLMATALVIEDTYGSDHRPVLSRIKRLHPEPKPTLPPDNPTQQEAAMGTMKS